MHKNNYLDFPPIARHLLPYLRRAEELEKHSPVASFFCRVYVAEQLNLIHQNEEGIEGLEDLIKEQIIKAEELKKNSKTKFTKEDFEYFCTGVFDGAENEYCNGNVSNVSLHAFYCASLFFDVLTQFGPLSQHFAEKRQFARWRATEIKKMLDNPNTSKSLNFSVEMPLEARETLELSSTMASTQQHNSSKPAEIPQDIIKDDLFLNELQSKNIFEAQKLAQQALSALNFNDVPTAKHFLTEALNALSN